MQLFVVRKVFLELIICVADSYLNLWDYILSPFHKNGYTIHNSFLAFL